MVGCLLLVIGFRSSSALAAAYGVAVTGTMAVTTLLFFLIARHRWHWSPLRAGALAGSFLFVDLAFFGANIIKIESGGWVPLAVASVVFLVMATWYRGTQLVMKTLARLSIPLDRFLEDVEMTRPPRVRGTAVFLTPNVEGAPPSLVLHFGHNKVLHEEVILVSIVTEEVPEVPDDRRIASERLPQGFYRVRAYYGFMERPDVQHVVAMCCDHGVTTDPEQTTYYVGRARLLPVGPAPMMRWRNVHVVERQLRDRLLPYPAGPRRRARRADRVLIPRGSDAPAQARSDPSGASSPASGFPSPAKVLKSGALDRKESCGGRGARGQSEIAPRDLMACACESHAERRLTERKGDHDVLK